MGSREQNKKIDSTPPLLQTLFCLYNQLNFLFLFFQEKIKWNSEKCSSVKSRTKKAAQFPVSLPAFPSLQTLLWQKRQVARRAQQAKSFMYHQVSLMDLIRASTSNHNFCLAYFLRSSKLLWSYSIKDKPCGRALNSEGSNSVSPTCWEVTSWRHLLFSCTLLQLAYRLRNY